VAIHDPNYDLRHRLKAIEEQLRRLRNTSPLAGTGLAVVDSGQLMQDGSVTIPNNGLLLVDGGDVVMLDVEPSATELFRLGVQEFLDRGLTVKRIDGSVVFDIKKVFASSDLLQKFRIHDSRGKVIAGDSILADSGFDAPHIPMPFYPVDPTVAGRAVTTSATTFTATHEHWGQRQNPALKPQFKVKCSDATTAAEIQVWDVLGSVYLGGLLGSPATLTITVPAGTTAFTVFGFSSALQLPGLMSDDVQLEVHARVTAGTGSVTIAPVKSIGTGF
jgi:hypothetical protein